MLYCKDNQPQERQDGFSIPAPKPPTPPTPPPQQPLHK